MDYSVGQIVYATCGREAGRLFAVVGVDGDYLWLADGRHRTLDRPKRKKKKHVRYAGDGGETLRQLLRSGATPRDAGLRRVLKQAAGNL